MPSRLSSELPRKLMRSIGVIAITLLSAVLLLKTSLSHAQAPTKGIEGTWQGTLHAGRDLRTVVKITKSPTGELTGQFYSIDQGGQGFPTSSMSFNDNVLRFAIKLFDLTYEGKLSAEGNTLTGASTQAGNALPLNLDRATAATAWEIPTPPPPIKPMPADANPSFDVATIKPSKPDVPGKMYRVEGRRFTTLNTTLADLITFSYGVHAKQIVNAPDWINTEKYDLAATPDIEGTPSDRQLKSMVQKLLAQRFEFKFHDDKRELSAYTLTVAKTGPKMDKGQGDPNSLPGLFFPKLGQLNAHNATMQDFAQLMQAAVLDRPVVDQTHLPGRWDFILKWTPDESQFSGVGIKVPPPTDAADAPPPLFTAIQEQIGLKLDAAKTSVPVLVVDHVAKPTAN